MVSGNKTDLFSMLGKLALYTDIIAVLSAESNTLKINQSFLFCWHYCYLNCWLLLFTSAHLYHLLVIKAQQYWLNKDGLMASIHCYASCPPFSFSHTHTILNIQYRSSTVHILQLLLFLFNKTKTVLSAQHIYGIKYWLDNTNSSCFDLL